MTETKVRLILENGDGKITILHGQGIVFYLAEVQEEGKITGVMGSFGKRMPPLRGKEKRRMLDSLGKQIDELFHVASFLYDDDDDVWKGGTKW